MKLRTNSIKWCQFSSFPSPEAKQTFTTDDETLENKIKQRKAPSNPERQQLHPFLPLPLVF